VIEIDKHIVAEVTDEIRFVDYAIAIFPQLMTKNSVKKALKRNELLLNGNVADSAQWMKKGDEIRLVDQENRVPKAFPLDIEVVFEDDYLVVVNKPSGISTSGNLYKTLENALVGKIQVSSQKDALKWVKPVHRLDAATSGLVILSKTATAHRILAKSFENREVIKTYHAIITGKMDRHSTVFNSPINKQLAETTVEVLQEIPSLRSQFLTLLQLSPETGRTHQLRIHCANNSTPIVGDTLYGEIGNTLLHKGLFLAATQLKFPHPIAGEDVEVKIELPYKFTSLLEREERRWRMFNSGTN